MTSLPGIDLVPFIIAASGLRVTPVGVGWPLHRALTRLAARDVGALERTFGDLELSEDREIGLRSQLAADSWAETVCSSLLRCDGTGLLARWRVDEQIVTEWRRQLLGVSPASARALAHAGKRWATLSETVLKNLDTAAESWGSTSRGDTSPPTVRQPLLALLR